MSATVNLGFKSFPEPLTCTPVEPGVVELREFSDFIALGPGDRLAVDSEGYATAIVSRVEVFMVEAFFPVLGNPAIERSVAHWHTAAIAAHLGPASNTARVCSTSLNWLRETVGGSELVEHIDLLRVPGTDVSLAAMIATEDELQ